MIAVVTVVAVLDVCVVRKSAWWRQRLRWRGCVAVGAAVAAVVTRLRVEARGRGGWQRIRAGRVGRVHGALSGRSKRNASMRRFLSMKPPTCRPS